jgi:hypothetical protein
MKDASKVDQARIGANQYSIVMTKLFLDLRIFPTCQVLSDHHHDGNDTAFLSFHVYSHLFVANPCWLRLTDSIEHYAPWKLALDGGFMIMAECKRGSNRVGPGGWD